MSPPSTLTLSLFLSLLLLLLGADASLHHQRHHRNNLLLFSSTKSSTSIPPTTFFEVTRPIPITSTTPPCSSLLLRHSFGFTYGQPPVTAAYSPPSHCPSHLSPPAHIVLEWSAACIGRQFDRIFGVWLSGVELLRSCTAEPRATGIVWTVKKDVTRYSSLFSQSGTLAVNLANLVDKTYTGIYNVTLSVHFYYDGHSLPNSLPGFDSPADLIMPISRNLPLNDGLWFLVQNSTDIESKELVIPRNAYRAVLEVYVSYHSSDEFWYTNPPDEYLVQNNISDVPGNGPFREVLVSVDGKVVGAVWPFTVIYTGGVNPLLWRPISGIGSFDLPTYDIEITPFLGKLLDGKPHKFGFGVTNALDVWFIDANLHLWLDPKRSYTVGNVIEYEAPPYVSSQEYNFKGLDGQIKTSANRHLSSTGWVSSSHGNFTTHFFQKLDYKNLLVFSEDGADSVTNQTIESSRETYVKNSSVVLYYDQVSQRFPLYLFSGTSDQVKNNYSLVSNISFGFNEKRFSGEPSGSSFSFLRNSQDGQGVMRVSGNLVVSGIGSTQQVYRYESTDGCYFRDVSSRNYTILRDESGDSCAKSKSGIITM